MWRRFTLNARKVIFYAQEEAGKVAQHQVGPEHILAGLLRDQETSAARILSKLNVSLEAIRSELARRMVQGEGRHGHDMQLTPEAKQVIDMGYEEAKGLSNDYIGAEHLLLGLLRSSGGADANDLASQILKEQRLDLETVRETAREMQQAASLPKPNTAPSPPEP